MALDSHFWRVQRQVARSMPRLALQSMRKIFRGPFEVSSVMGNLFMIKQYSNTAPMIFS
ncbi:hypothetical protein AG1IA_01998 [Rhizoctonia solani AG-1 IA]|uniref:Uncharacterized protein n=1 Tax=Thanatephorus cucumeris (strain AG1-IA) TaxID=983506 RepID=L8X5Q7_THACA|nr:hypothetical protein AG1IA_01998 [Rhizoctonia solani AG-1 IA]